MVKFAVGVDGSITHFEIIQSGGTDFDNEVIRVLKKMPKWKPAVQNGRNVAVMFTQPVTFMAFEE
jgi:protein TonB